MSFTVRGNGDDVLRRMALHLREAPKYVMREAAQEVRAMIERRIQNQFVTGIDPYGRRWKKPKDGHTPPMIRTGALMGGFKVRVVPGGIGVSIAVSNSKPYAKILQRGTSRMEARMTVPGATLPDAWKADIGRISMDALQRWWARGP